MEESFGYNFFNTFINDLDENCITVDKICNMTQKLLLMGKNNKGNNSIIQTD